MEEKTVFNATEYKKQYNKEKYKTYKIYVKPDLDLYLKSYCEKYGKTASGLFLEAVKDYTGYMGND